MSEPHTAIRQILPGLLAIDADGYVWRCYETGWSIAPMNPDNSPIPQPLTYYEPAAARTPTLPAELEVRDAEGSHVLTVKLVPGLYVSHERLREVFPFQLFVRWPDATPRIHNLTAGDRPPAEREER